MQPIHLFTFKDIPVSLNPMFLLLLLILSYGAGTIGAMIVFCICAAIGILVHEFGHALMARKYRLNPKIILTGFGGVTQQSRSAGPKQEFLITLMGPLTNLILGGICFAVLAYLGNYIIQVPYLQTFVYWLMVINIFWGIFNLLPAKPMDGYKVCSYLIGKVLKQDKLQIVMTIVSVIFVLGILAWSIYHRNTFMIIMSFFFIMANLGDVKLLFSKSGQKQQKMLSIQAEALYEKGLVASRQHDWQTLEMVGHQMKKVAEGKEQIGRAYELLTIACTNLGKYDEALKYSEHARQSDPVKKAVRRCEHELEDLL